MGGVIEEPVPVLIPPEHTEPVHPAHHAALKTRIVKLEQLCGFGHGAEGGHHLPAWLRPTKGESRWSVTIAVTLIVVLQLKAPKDLAFQPIWLLPGLEVLLFVLLTIGN